MPHLSIGALGPLVITLDGQTITGLAYDKVWALLVYLAHSTDHPHRRESLAGLLWPDQPEEKARTNLRQALARLRQAIGDANATPPFLLIEHAGIQFNGASDATLDVTEFSSLLTACAAHAHRHAESCAACAQRREQAVALYRGAFLDKFHVGDSDLFEEWTTLVREPLHQQAMDALAALVVYHERHGNYAQALHYSERQLELDPWREEAYRQMMRILALNGQRSAALHRYERCRTMLDTELGVAPAAETTALYEQIRAAELDGPVKADYLALPTKRRHSLPLQPTPFIGRQPELAALADLIADPQCRLITLLGPGGTGKSRLALQAASDEGEAFADGTTYVSLAPLNAAAFIVPTVAAALDVTLAGHAAPQTELLHVLRQKELLLVFDNFEHLLAPLTPSPVANGNGSATELLTAILQQAPGVTMLATSRERLNVQGEWVFDVGGLETPAEPYRAGEEQTAAFEAYSAVALFLQTARRVQKGFEPTAAERAAIVRICQLVQGMPLALELAAAWVRVLSCREIAQEIAQSLGFLTTPLRDLPERHRSLQAVFDHSWKLLSVEEQRVFACCSVFRGGFTREAAAEVADASLSLLAALVDKSLLRRQLNGRYEVHELARQYAAARLADADQEAQTRNRHLLFFMRFAEAAEPHIRSGEQIVQWHEWVEVEHDNLRAALDWSLRGGAIEPGLRIVAALWEFWMAHGHAPEGQTQAERFLARPEAAAYPVLRGKALHTAGVCAFYHGRFLAARAWLAEAAALGRELGESGRYVLALALLAQSYTLMNLHDFDTAPVLSQEALMLSEELQVSWLKGDALYQLAAFAWRRGDYRSAHQRFLESLACFQADGGNYSRGYVLQGLGTMLHEQGDYAAAHAYLRQSLAICEELGDKVRSSSALTRLGRLAMAQGNDAEAEELLAKALMLIRETGHLLSRTDPLDALGRLAQRQGSYARARTLHQESLSLSIAIEHPARLAHTLEALACLAARQGQAEAAVRLFGATERYLTATQGPIGPTWQLEHDQEYDHLVAIARTQLGEATFAAAWAAGAAMTLDEAAALVEAERFFLVDSLE
jgi:predicted ATPase/Tfp pilus assembly protein PilF